MHDPVLRIGWYPRQLDWCFGKRQEEQIGSETFLIELHCLAAVSVEAQECDDLFHDCGLFWLR
jgi:hypothetical protein